MPCASRPVAARARARPGGQRPRARAGAGDTRAADRLIDLLAARGDKQELEKEVFAGYSLGLYRLVNIWFHGDSDVANFNLRLRMFGLEPEGSIFDRASES